MENMKLITDRYEEIKDSIEFEDSKDELIVECYKHKIFREKPSKRLMLKCRTQPSNKHCNARVEKYNCG